MPPNEDGTQKTNAQRREYIMHLIADKQWGKLLEYDELFDHINSGKILQNFRTVAPNFRPTFKVLRHVDGSERDLKAYYNDKRTPSYCDRILWHSLPGLREKVRVHKFESCEDFKSSDHKPVMARFSVVPTARYEFSDEGFKNPQTQSTVYPQLKFFDLRAYNLIASDVGFYVKRKSVGHLDLQDGEVRPRKGGLSIHKGKSDPYIIFLSNPSELFLEAQRNRVHTRYKTQNLNPVWQDIVNVALRVKSYETFSEGHITLLIMDHDFGTADDPIGVVTLSLKEIAEAADSDSGIFEFERPVIYFGKHKGRLSGKIEVNMPGPSGDFKHIDRCKDTRSIKASTSLGCCHNCTLS